MHVPVLLVSLMYVRITLRVNYTCISPIRKYTNDCKFKETIKSFDRTYIWEFPEPNTSTANLSVMSGQSGISSFILGTSYQDLMLFTSYHCECIFQSLFRLNSAIGGIHHISINPCFPLNTSQHLYYLVTCCVKFDRTKYLALLMFIGLKYSAFAILRCLISPYIIMRFCYKAPSSSMSVRDKHLHPLTQSN